MDDVRIDGGTLSDLDALAEMWTDLVGSQREYGAHLFAGENRETARDFLGQAVAADNVLVARDGDRAVGFVQFREERGVYDQDSARGFVDNVYVRPGDRNDGVGGQLLAAAERHLAERGMDAVALSVLAGNRAARRFYERRGYRTHRVEMERSLPGESDTHTKGGDEP
jgi:ribosomal protein S18 acetylase RimI-like enzyme